MMLYAKKKSSVKFVVKAIAELPAEVGQTENPGLAGVFSGVIGNKLIIAGGANFPEKKPWEGGTKVFHDRIYVYSVADTILTLVDNAWKLPLKAAYGASVSIPEGLLVIGGNDIDNCLTAVNLIQWNQSGNNLEIISYPELPFPLSFATAVLLNNSVYLIGGSGLPNAKDTGAHFLKLDLTKHASSDFGWEILPSFLGTGRVFAPTAVQSNGSHDCIFLAGGRILNDNNEYQIFNDGQVYDPELNRWEYLSNRFQFPVMAGSAFPVDSSLIVFVGGATADSFMQQIAKEKDLSDAKFKNDPVGIATSKEKLLNFYQKHPGFSREIYVYNTLTGLSFLAGRFEPDCPVTTRAVPFKGGAIITSGEIMPGTRTPEIFLVMPVKKVLGSNRNR